VAVVEVAVGIEGLAHGWLGGQASVVKACMSGVRLARARIFLAERSRGASRGAVSC